MIWTIIGLLILSSVWYFFKLGMIKTTTDAAKYVKEKRKITRLNSDPNKLEEEWKIRVRQLNIDLNNLVMK